MAEDGHAGGVAVKVVLSQSRREFRVDVAEQTCGRRVGEMPAGVVVAHLESLRDSRKLVPTVPALQHHRRAHVAIRRVRRGVATAAGVAVLVFLALARTLRTPLQTVHVTAVERAVRRPGEFQITIHYQNLHFGGNNGTFSINTALAFADGYFALTNSLYGPFIIVAPQSSLKKASISVSNAIDSSASVSRKTFGNVLYTRLSMYKPNNIVVFASNGSLFTSSGSFLFKATPVARQGFLAKISLESSIAVSGILRHDAATPYDSYSSPIYDVTIADDGVSVANMEIDTDSYFFTDIDGRYILSDLKSGTYMIDLNVDGQWYAAFFEVPSTDKPGYVALYKDFDASILEEGSEIMQKYDVKTFDESYAGSLYLEIDSYITEEEYWDMLFQIADWEDEWEDWDDELDEDSSQYQTVENSSL